MPEYTYTLAGFDGTWARVRSGSDAQIRRLLVKAGTHTADEAADALRWGDTQFTHHNPRTGQDETYALVREDGQTTMFRRI